MGGDPILEDRRVLDLRYRMPIGQINEFFAGLEKGKVSGTKCRKCGRIYFPPQSDCSDCMARDVEWIDFSGNSTLETYTIVEVAPTSFSDKGSYVVAIGLLDEGVRVLSWLNVEDRSKIKLGMNMRLRAVKKEEGFNSYEFYPE